MRRELQRNVAVAALVIAAVGCAHATMIARLEDIPEGCIVAATGILALAIVIVLDIICAVSARTSWLLSVVAIFGALLITACRNLAMHANVEELPAVVIIAAGIVAAVCTAAQIADDLDREDIILVAPFTVELVALARLLTDGAYDGLVLACSACTLAVLTPMILTPTRRRVVIKEW